MEKTIEEIIYEETDQRLKEMSQYFLIGKTTILLFSSASLFLLPQ